MWSWVNAKQFSSEFKDAYTSETLTDQYNAVKNDESRYVWNKIFNIKNVAKKEGKIYSLGKQGMQIVDSQISSKGWLHKIDFDVKSRDMFRLQDYGFYADVYSDEVLNPDAPVDAERDKLLLLRSIHNLTKENQALSLAMDPANNPNNIALAPADQFSNPTSDPYAVFNTIRNTVRTASGMRPNKIVMTQDIMDALTVHPKILERYKYTVTLTDTQMREILMREFGFTEIHVVESMVRSGDADVDGGTMAEIIENKMLVFYSSTEEFLMPLSFGTVYTRSIDNVRTVQPDARTQRIERIASTVWVDAEYQFVISNADAGLLITDVLA